MATMKLGYHSMLAEATLGHPSGIKSYVQIGPNGERVTAWFDTHEQAEIYKWQDKVFVGEFDVDTFEPVCLNPMGYDPFALWDDPLYEGDE